MVRGSGEYPESSVGLRLMYGCMPISPDIVDDAESLTTFPPFKAASAERDLTCQNPNHPHESVGMADVQHVPLGITLGLQFLTVSE